MYIIKIVHVSYLVIQNFQDESIPGGGGEGSIDLRCKVVLHLTEIQILIFIAQQRSRL
jgi:hypothetical protein